MANPSSLGSIGYALNASAAGAIASAACAQSEVAEHLDRLNSATENLDRIRDTLRRRLDPVLRVQPPAVTANKLAGGDSDRPLSLVSEMIRASTRRIDATAADIEDLLAALAV